MVCRRRGFSEIAVKISLTAGTGSVRGRRKPDGITPASKAAIAIRTLMSLPCGYPVVPGGKTDFIRPESGCSPPR
jgi:hypothetical protein